MEVSTPITNKGSSLRRRTLMKLVDTPITTEPVNDESERSSRRSIIETQKKAQVAQSPSLNDSVRFSGEQEIKDHFQICSKLFAENKITVGVAWQLQIIDLLRVVSRKQNSNTLQVASTSLDIGAKVYGIRVDDVHAEGLKLANSMARFAEKNQIQERDNEDDGGNEENEDAAQPAKKKKKKFRYTEGVKNTIVKDRKSLLAPIPELESVFFSNRIDSNLSTVDNLFTNSLPMDKSYYKLLALGEEKAWATGPDEAVEGLEELKSFDIDLLPKGGHHICIPFQNFILNQWNPEEEEQTGEKNDALTNDIVVYDATGIPIAELDGSIHDVFNDVGLGGEEDDDEPPTEEFMAQQIQHEVAHVVDLMKTQSELQRSEYSYNSVITVGNGKVIDQIWAGPSHWKLKFLRRSRAMFSGRVEAQSVARTKKKLKLKEPEPIDVENCEGVDKLLENLRRIKIKKKIYPANKITLPLADASNRSMMNDIYELMIKPGTVLIAKSDSTMRVENGPENFDDGGLFEAEDNDGDIDNGMDHMDNDPGNDMEEEEIAINREQNFMGDNLVDAPEYVAKVYIPYALQAKKMDIKKLKGYIWQQLTHSSDKASKKVIPTTFSAIFDDLPNVLPQAMKKELSCSLAFAALLHLCNEETLKLTQMLGYKDFKIESG